MTASQFRGFNAIVVGSCQVRGLAWSLRELLPGATVDCVHVGVSPADSPQEILASLKKYDLVVSQFAYTVENETLRWEAIQAASRRAVLLPTFAFAGFHPDCTYIIDERAGLLGNGVFVMHSAIVAACYLLGLPEERVPGLFNAFIYRSVGYFDAYEAGKRAALASWNGMGYDLENEWDLWMKGGCFMHTVNHPAVRVLASLARLAVVRAGLAAPEVTLQGLPDALADSVIWPVLPEIARHVGCGGSTDFMRPTADVPEGSSRRVGLPEFIRLSYETYRTYPQFNLRSPRVEDIYEKLKSVCV